MTENMIKLLEEGRAIEFLFEYLANEENLSAEQKKTLIQKIDSENEKMKIRHERARLVNRELKEELAKFEVQKQCLMNL